MDSKVKTVLCIYVVLLFGIHSYGQTVNDLRPTVTMKEYVDGQVDLLEEMNKLRDEHQREISRIKDEHIKTAYASQDKRLDGMNEFRKTLEDSNKTYITKSELNAWFLALVSFVGMAAGLFWGWSRHVREKKRDELNSSNNIQSGDKVEVKK